MIFLQDVNNSKIVGIAMEELIYNLADNHFFFNDLEVSAFKILVHMYVVKWINEQSKIANVSKLRFAATCTRTIVLRWLSNRVILWFGISSLRSIVWLGEYWLMIFNQLAEPYLRIFEKNVIGSNNVSYADMVQFLPFNFFTRL